MKSLFILLSIVSSVFTQFMPRFRYYAPQELLYDYVDPAPQLAFTMDSFPSFAAPNYKPYENQEQKMTVLRHLPSFGGSTNINSRKNTGKFDSLLHQPGMVPKITGGFVKNTEIHSYADPLRQPGEAPKFTGGFMRGREDEPVRFHPSSTIDAATQAIPDAAANSFLGPVTNPAATFLAGSHFEKLSVPKCRMLNCAGPVPNDGSASTSASNLRTGSNSACSQILVPINGCAGGQGYPMAMLCSVCCECTAPLISELLKTAKNFQQPAFH